MTYCVVRTVYYGPDWTMYQGRMLNGASLDEARDCVTRWCDWDLSFLNVMHGDGAYTDMPLWSSQKRRTHITKIVPSLKYCGSFSKSQPREIVYEIWEEAEPDKNIKEEITMTNAEMAKQIKELEERLDRYRDVVDGQICIYDGKFKQLNERLGRIEHRLDSMDDAGTYVRQVAEESKKIEDALKVTTRKLDLFSQKNAELMERNKGLSEQNVKLQEDVKASNKMCDAVSKKASKLADRVQKLEADSSRTLRLEDLVWQHEAQLAKALKLEDHTEQLETKIKNLKLIINSVYGARAEAKTIGSMYPCLWNCEHKGKECNGQAQECPIADHFSKQLQDACNYCRNDVAVTQAYLKKFMENKKDIIFSEFNAGKRAIVFNGSDHLEKDYLDFCRAFDEWCSTSETKDKLYPQSKWTTREKRMDPLMKCPSIYEDRSSFAIWVEHNDEKGDRAFKYHTLQKDGRKYNTVCGLPYTEWGV